MALIDRYLKTVRKHTKFRATWPPSAPIAIGDVGRIVDGAFIQVTTLRRLGIRFTVDSDPVDANVFSFQSEGVSSVEVKAEGKASPNFSYIGAAKAGVRVAFSSADAVVIKTKNTTVDHIADQATLEAALLDSVKPTFVEGEKVPPRWQRDWVVVTEVVEAGAATIIASIDSDAAIELEASADVTQADLVDVDAGLTAVFSSSVGLEVIAKQGLTPFYRGIRVKRKWWWLWDDRVVPAGYTPPDSNSIGDLFGDDADDADDAEEGGKAGSSLSPGSESTPTTPAST
jgi:hypothetical protein